jgi:hypothetical protein
MWKKAVSYRQHEFAGIKSETLCASVSKNIVIDNKKCYNMSDTCRGPQKDVAESEPRLVWQEPLKTELLHTANVKRPNQPTTVCSIILSVAVPKLVKMALAHAKFMHLASSKPGVSEFALLCR